MKSWSWRAGLAAIVAASMLAGCLPEVEGASEPTPAPGETAPNSPPVIGGTPTTSAVAGTLWQFQPVATDADGDALTFAASAVPSWLSFSPETGRLSGTPAETDAGSSATIVVSVSDGEASSALPGFSIRIASAVPPPAEPPPPAPPANTAPQISGTPATSVQATTAYSFTPTATDAEAPQSLAFSIANKPAWASFSAVTGRLSGTPSATQAGTYGNIVISVSDGALGASLPAFSITVTPVPNRAPTITGTPGTSTTVGTAYSFQPTGSDPDGQTLSYTIANKPAWASFSTTTGRLSGTPADAHVGTTSGIVITVSDGTLTASLAPFLLTVAARPNSAPTVSGTPPTSTTVGTAYRFAPTASDADGDTLSWSITGKPSTATFSTATGELTWTPTGVGTASNIVIRVTDSQGASASLPAFSITVSAPPATGSATLNWMSPAQYTDGSPLPAGELSGFRIYKGTSASNLARIAEVDSLSTSFAVQNLGSGTHYFAVTAVATSGVESSMSAVGSKTIP